MDGKREWKPKEINAENLLLVEGKDEVYFFEKIFKQLYVGGIQIQEVGGKDNFNLRLPVVDQLSSFRKNVRKVCIIRDSDENQNNTLRSVKKLLEKINWPCPEDHAKTTSGEKLTIGIFLMPGKEKPGALEDLIIESVKENTEFEHIENLFNGLQKIKPFVEDNGETHGQVFFFV